MDYFNVFVQGFNSKQGKLYECSSNTGHERVQSNPSHPFSLTSAFCSKWPVVNIINDIINSYTIFLIASISHNLFKFLFNTLQARIPT